MGRSLVDSQFCVNLICLLYSFCLKAFFILFATIGASFCTESANVEVSTPLPAVSESPPQKRAILGDCDGPVAGVVGGLHSDFDVHSDLAIGLHGHSYAPAYSGGYLGSGGIIGAVGSVGHVGGIVASPSLVSAGYAHGYAPHASVVASSVISSPVVSHAPVFAAPAVCQLHFFFFKYNVFLYFCSCSNFFSFFHK